MDIARRIKGGELGCRTGGLPLRTRASYSCSMRLRDGVRARPMTALVSYRPLAILRVVRLLLSVQVTIPTTRQHTFHMRSTGINGSYLLVCHTPPPPQASPAQTRDEWSHSSSSVCSASARLQALHNQSMRTRSAATSLRSVAACGEESSRTTPARRAACSGPTASPPRCLPARALAPLSRCPSCSAKRDARVRGHVDSFWWRRWYQGHAVDARATRGKMGFATIPFPQVREAHLRGAHDQLASVQLKSSLSRPWRSNAVRAYDKETSVESFMGVFRSRVDRRATQLFGGVGFVTAIGLRAWACVEIKSTRPRHCIVAHRRGQTIACPVVAKITLYTVISGSLTALAFVGRTRTAAAT